MAKEVTVIEKPPVYIASNWQDGIKVFAVGALVGLGVNVLALSLQRFFIEPVFCRSSDLFGVCNAGNQVSNGIAVVVMSLVALAILARLNVFRPLLVAAAAAATLWGVAGYLTGLAISSPLEQAAWMVGLFGLAYVLFFWVLRLRQFIPSILLSLLIVIAVRFLLVS